MVPQWNRRSEKEQAAVKTLIADKPVKCDRCGLPTRRPWIIPATDEIICTTCQSRRPLNA